MNTLAHRQLALQRLKWCLMKETGKSYYAVAQKHAVSPSSVHTWHTRWIKSEKKFESLFNKRSGPVKPPNTRTDIEKDLKALYKSNLRGYPLLRAMRARGHTLAMSTLYDSIKRLKLSTPKPKNRPKKKYVKLSFPFGWVQADTMYLSGKDGPVQYTAIECQTRLRFMRIYPEATKDNSVDFIKRCLEFFRFDLAMWHTDSGFEWVQPQKMTETMVYFDRPHPVRDFLRSIGLIHHTTVGKPQQQGRVERSHRIDRESWYGEFPLEDAVRDHHEWLRIYNETRPHGALGWKTPRQALEAHLKQPVTLNYDLAISDVGRKAEN